MIKIRRPEFLSGKTKVSVAAWMPGKFLRCGYVAQLGKFQVVAQREIEACFDKNLRPRMEARAGDDAKVIITAWMPREF